jgi:tmRNA-binding protein
MKTTETKKAKKLEMQKENLKNLSVRSSVRAGMTCIPSCMYMYSR